MFDIYNSSETLLVKYYFALEHELPIANESSFTKQFDEIQHSVKGIPMYITKDILNTVHDVDSPRKFLSLGFYQIPISEIGSWDVNIEVLHKALASQGNKKSQKFLDSLGREDNRVEQLRTVVSVVTIVEPNTETFNQDNLPSSLVESINLLSDFIRALKLKMHYPYEVNQETLHPAVMRTSETLDGFLMTDKIVDQRIISLRNESTDTKPAATVDEFASIVLCFQRHEAKDPMLRYLEYKNKGANDLHKNGLYSSACMNFGIASEIIFSSVLSLSLWEDFIRGKISEEEAATIMALSLAKRVKQAYPHRFGGNIISMLDEWNANIASPRHKVAHSGKELSKDVAIKSLDTLASLRNFILDTLANSLSKYPRTTWIVLGEEELKSRNVIKSAQKQKNKIMASGDSGKELDWLKKYNIWMDNIEPLVRQKRLYG